MTREELNLKEYLRQDEIYQKWKQGKLDDISDFDNFCIEHCKDIQVVLNMLEDARKYVKREPLVDEETDTITISKNHLLYLLGNKK